MILWQITYSVISTQQAVACIQIVGIECGKHGRLLAIGKDTRELCAMQGTRVSAGALFAAGLHRQVMYGGLRIGLYEPVRK
jgi:hypothetical protein